MGGWDEYCAFCGVVVPRPWLDENPEADSQYGYDPQLVSSDDASWMSDMRMIGENPSCTDSDKVFVTATCSTIGYGSFQAPPGDDPHVPAPQPGRNTTDIHAYQWESQDPVAFPFHYICYAIILRNMIWRRIGADTIDNEVLYGAMKTFSPVKQWTHKLEGLDYGELSECQEQYFVTKRGQEAVVMFPGTNRDLIDFYDGLPSLATDSHHGPMRQTSVAALRTGLTALPTEVVLTIMMKLPSDALDNFRACSKRLFDMSTDDGFWQTKFDLDMPWMYDIPQFVRKRGLDWAKVYRLFHRKLSSNGDRSCLGLINRHRIWTICEPLVDEYLVRLREKEQRMQDERHQLLSQAICSPMPRLIWPQPSKATTSILPMVRALTSDNDFHSSIDVFWSTEGHLAGLGISHFRDPDRSQVAETTRVGDDNKFAHKDSVVIDKSSWLIGVKVTVQEHQSPSDGKKRSGDKSLSRRCVGLELLSRDPSHSVQFGNSEGSQRLLGIFRDHLLVGLRVEWSESHGIAKIGLLQLPLPYGPYTWRDLRPVREELLDCGDYVMQGLWKDRLPPPGTQMSKPSLGYWSFDFKTDIEPMEALVFGSNEQDLASITSFSADIRFGAFEVGYTDGSTKRIGPHATAMRTLEIDGANGERIIGISVMCSYVYTGFRVYTNRSRLLDLGGFSNDQRQRGRHLVPPAGRFVAGIYCHWEPASGGQAKLELCGLMSLPGSYDEPCDLASLTQRDELGLVWDPHPPPADWVTYGPLVGQYDRIERRGMPDLEVPGDSTVATWLGCQKPVERILAAFVHPGVKPALRLAGLAFFFSDGSKGVVGPDPERLKRDKEQGAWTPACSCHLGDGGVREEKDKQSHYKLSEWAVGGSTLREAKVWVDNWPVGMQMTADNGAQSPRWGVCEGETYQTIKFADTTNDNPVDGAVGLKIVMNRDGPSVTYPDTNIVGFQALVLRTMTEEQTRQQASVPAGQEKLKGDDV